VSKVSRSTRVDRNRLAKTYPFLHRVPKYTYINEPPISYEIGEICFLNNDTVTYSFDAPYVDLPSIVITSKGDDLNVWIDVLTTTSVTFRSSVITNSCVSFQIVSIGT
jgi:hypothetical protein